MTRKSTGRNARVVWRLLAIDNKYVYVTPNEKMKQTSKENALADEADATFRLRKTRRMRDRGVRAGKFDAIER